MVPIVLHRELRRPHSRPISFRQNNRSAVRLLQKHAFTASLAALPRLFYPAIAFSRGDLSPLRIRRQVDGKKSGDLSSLFREATCRLSGSADKSAGGKAATSRRTPRVVRSGE